METEDLSPRGVREQLNTLQADAVVAGRRSAAPLWYLTAQALCCAVFVLSFSFGRWEAMGFASAGVALCLLGMLRPVITGTRADPWAYRRSLKVGAVLAAFLLVMLGAGMFALGPGSPPAVPAAAALLTFGVTLALGIRMERAFSRSVTDAA
ncbi:hypothetical protein OL239_13765 [Arthrobacter sp. ATA002]|uniref:hypothetical protein n=1 Tax=Arthrobacter sp. ATA002 TaxID=2991715 RepID=UPI0022A7DECF|nr:hypothetical protein [Arthrobacter sp. ATA002]WAP50991.1 hypothetical protein OL239_13765 [Arthrobacter sp. ATA002]